MNWIAKIFMALLGLAFLVALLFGVACYTVYATLRWLLTGRKPQVVLVWQQFSAMRQNFKQGGFRAGLRRALKAPGGNTPPTMTRW